MPCNVNLVLSFQGRPRFSTSMFKLVSKFMPKSHRYSGDESVANTHEIEARLRRILKAAPQDLWLDTMRRTYVGLHDDLVFWMLNQPECDFAVAASAFYRRDPIFHLDRPRALPLTPAHGQTFAQVLLNWDKGFFRNHALQIDHRDVSPHAIARLKQKYIARPRGSLPFTIPDQLLDPKGGKPAQLPEYRQPDNAPHLWPLYSALGLRVPSTPPGLKRRLANISISIPRIQLFSNQS